MIRVEKIDKYFNRFKRNKIHVINNTSLTFEEKGLVALLGPSGSGKTTLLNVIGGLDKVRKGKIYVNGKKITHRTQGTVDKIRNLNIGYIFQDYKLIEDKSVYENVAISLRLVGIKDKKEIDKRVCYILDKVGMLRFKRRPCNMLSGGERQRVGIARAIVKNPNIVIADEPTGNLDSKNSIEIMNIIKSISKDKLVILVTHEKDLANFYATRIIELEDGKIISDRPNETPDELDYNIINNLYLKDFRFQEDYKDIHMYSNTGEVINLNIVVANNNIYIKTDSNKKIEVIDDESSITMVNDHYKNISKEEVEKYRFDFQNIINEPRKIRYSSIFNPFTFITSGIKKVLNYTFLKKILLFGFFLSGIFIVYAMSSIKASITVKDEKFVKLNSNYLIIETKKINYEDYLKLEQNEDIEYIIPGDSSQTLKLIVDDFYQFTVLNATITGSITKLDTIDEKDLVKGRWPENNKEIVVDRLVIKKLLKQEEQSKMFGITKEEDFLEREINVDNMGHFKIAGIVNKKHPSIYVSEENLISLIYHVKNISDSDYIYMSTEYVPSSYDGDYVQYDDYHLYQNDLVLKEGSWPDGDYETMVDISQKESIKLNTEINKKINEHKLKVVGYYSTKKQLNTYFVSPNTMKIYLITKSSNIAVYPKNKERVLQTVRDEYKMTIKDSYETSKEAYLKENKERMKSSIITAAIILGISLIEILLMIRSSFLSRVKEVGIYRAIGVKKKDIYIMFSGEIIAITTIASLPGILLSAYIMNILASVEFLQDYLMMGPDVVIASVGSIYLFNTIVGLIPVFATMRKRPAEILARTDI